jgi:hypothetical protein
MKDLHLKRLDRLAKEHEKRAKRRERLEMRYFAFDCKTPACSLGHACFIPEFRKAGLRLKPETEAPDQKFWPYYRGKNQDAGQASFFGINEYDDAKWLFGYEHRRSHTQQARVIRAFVAKQRKAIAKAKQVRR